MVVILSSLQVVLKIACVCVLRSNSRVDFARYVFLKLISPLQSMIVLL